MSNGNKEEKGFQKSTLTELCIKKQKNMIDKETVDWNQRGAEKVENIIFKGRRRN